MPETAAVPFSARVVQRLGVPPGSRTERVIHSLDGIEAPVIPDDLTATGRQLWSLVNAKAPQVETGRVDFLLGLDAGGILPTIGLATASGLPYKIAWKLNLPLHGAVRFREPHATRTDVYAYGIASGQRMILVDDEVTTGRTLADLTHRLREADAHPLAAICLVEDVSQGARQRLEALGLPLIAMHTLERRA